MSCRRSLTVLSLAVFVSVGCDTTRPVVTASDISFQAQRSASAQTVPFQTSSYTFHVTAVVPEPGCDAAGESRRYVSGEGTGTHLGSYTVDLSFCSRAGGILDDGRGAFVAANGDLLRFTFHGTSTFNPPFTLSFTSYNDFGGGTGRFGSATGQAVVTGTLDVRTGTGDGRYEGVISSVGSSTP